MTGSPTDPFSKGAYRHDVGTCDLLGAVDQRSLVHALQDAIDEAEEDITDFIARDYDDDIDGVGDDVFDWELAALREAGGRLQAACSVVVALYRDDESIGTTFGQCWCLIELAERPWQGRQLTPSRSWLAIDRDEVVPWAATGPP